MSKIYLVYSLEYIRVKPYCEDTVLLDATSIEDLQIQLDLNDVKDAFDASN